MKKKECFKCGTRKSLTEFYKHPQMKDGRVNKCKECNKVDVRENRQANIDYYRAYDRERGCRQPADYGKHYKRNNPIAAGARQMVGNAIRDKRLKKEKRCAECKISQRTLHAHHDDYAKPLDVRWLCLPCHFAWHAKHGQGLNG